MADKCKVIEILKKHPKGIKAKDIAGYISGADRKEINQILYSNPNLFSCNDKYEWTLSSGFSIGQEAHISITNTEAEIKECFRKNYINDETLEFLKRIDQTSLKLVSKRYLQLSQSAGLAVFGYILKRNVLKDLMLITNADFDIALDRSKRLKEVANIKEYDVWKELVFSSNFEIIYQNIERVRGIEKLSKLSTEEWLKVIQLKNKEFDVFTKRVELLTKSISSIFIDFASLALNPNYKTIENRVKTISSLQKQKAFPSISCYSHAWDTLITVSDKNFDMYLKHSKRIYEEKDRILYKINSPYSIINNREVIDIVLLDDILFTQFCDNIASYKHSPFIDSLEYEDWKEFFLQDSIKFNLSYKNTKKIDKAISSDKISKPSEKVWRTFAWLPPREFTKMLEAKSKEHIGYKIMKEDEARINEKISTTISHYRKNPLRQCTGNCSVCSREECPLDKK